nr:ATPase subunit 8 [Petillopsis calcar]
MPQMSPLWWELLFIWFLTSFLFMNMIMYFNKSYSPLKKLKSNNSMINEFKWKW